MNQAFNQNSVSSMFNINSLTDLLLNLCFFYKSCVLNRRSTVKSRAEIFSLLNRYRGFIKLQGSAKNLPPFVSLNSKLYGRIYFAIQRYLLNTRKYGMRFKIKLLRRCRFRANPIRRKLIFSAPLPYALSADRSNSVLRCFRNFKFNKTKYFRDLFLSSETVLESQKALIAIRQAARTIKVLKAAPNELIAYKTNVSFYNKQKFLETLALNYN